MTALNFPANPLNGDEFEGYVYDSTLGVWNRKPSTVAYTVSANAPINPNDGDVWFNEQDGSSYIYYIDGDSEQWVEIGGKVGATGAAGQNGTDGINGTDGVDGVDGVGVIVGGTTGQVLAKASATDYDTEWVDVAVGPQPANTIASDNIALDFSDGVELEQRAVTGDVTFTASNYTSGVKKTIYLEGDTVQRSLTFPANWNFITDTPTAIGANKKNLLDLNSFGTSESTTVALWLGVSAFEPIVATGGTESEIVISGVTYKLHTFTSSASLTVSSPGEAQYLMVGGGGGGGRYGGGGAGGVLYSSGFSLPGGLSSFVIGAGGAGSNTTNGTNGGSTTAFGLSAIGGGAGSESGNGSSGGSGGGGSFQGSGGSGTSGQGNSGGSGTNNGTNYSGGGGGGASVAGSNATVNISGKGGDGFQWINGLFYAGGGSGATFQNSDTVSVGGQGGGGTGAKYGGSTSISIAGSNGTNGLGGGGGGAYSGGSGTVIIAYPITDPN